MTSQTRASWWAAAALAVICALPCTARASQFLSSEIASALSERSAFLRGIELAEKDFFSLKSSLASSDKQNALRNRLNITSRGGPWRHYVRGAVEDAGGDKRSAQSFSKAIEEAATDPGALWLLLVEFIRGGHTKPADECLETLRAWILASGGRAAPLLSQQLILLGNTIADAAPNSAEYCYNASKRFDENQCWWLYRKGAIGFPNNAMAAMPGFIAEASATVIKSWRAQASLLCGLHRFFSAALFIFACAVFFTFAVKYLPHGVHPIGDTLFAPAAPSVRTFSSVAVVASMLLLGVVPTLWATAFLVCRFLSASEKKLLVFSCLILVFSPLNFYVTGFLNRCIDPNSPAVLLDRSIREGYSQELYLSAAKNIAARPGNYAGHIARAVSAIKSGDLKISSEAMSKALEAAPNDPIALMYAGSLSFLTSDADGMERYYGGVLKEHPQYAAEAKYSLSQAYAGNGDFTTSDMISEAAKINSPMIGGHMRANDNYFGENPPPLRRVIQPALSPAYFWSRLFIANPAEILQLKGETYYGLSPVAAFGASAAVMLIFLIFYFTAWGKASKVKKYFTC
ncbi:MAG: hypothetical protein LBH93_05190, partial [Chitinispirillales bacterium]|nr:hypothetical protein [Chitinispirillales bacterium]